MLFNDIVKNYAKSLDLRNISLYPISEYNLEGIKILLDNCMRMGTEQNSNVELATINPSIWLSDLLNKHWNKISYVSTKPTFEILKIDSDVIVSKSYKVDSLTFNSDDELDNFFEQGKWKRFVLFSIVKYANLSTMTCYYEIKYSDVTEKFEERDNKINFIIGTDQVKHSDPDFW